MKFNEYLRKCRERSTLTQEQLVQALYVYDTDHFETLETSTLSKWERGLTKPKTSKQVSILRYFQNLTGDALPCFNDYAVDEAEELICKAGMQNLLGNSKELVLNFPSAMIGADDLHVYQLRNSQMIDDVIAINIDMDKDFTHNTTKFTPKQFKEWALHPSNSFYICEYKSQFFGLLFTLRLKPEVFERIMNLEMEGKDLTVEDFASFNEIGCNYTITFFAMNEKAATILLIRHYAHLIVNQKVIAEVGLVTIMEDAKKFIRNMNLHKHRSKDLGKDLVLQTYRETLPMFLTSEEVVKMILSKQEVPEE